jgi:hypothetical protein
MSSSRDVTFAFRLRHGAVADLRLDLRPDLERDLVVGRASRLRQLGQEFLVEALVDLGRVGLVLELETYDRALGRGDVHLRLELCSLVA